MNHFSAQKQVKWISTKNNFRYKSKNKKDLSSLTSKLSNLRMRWTIENNFTSKSIRKTLLLKILFAETSRERTNKEVLNRPITNTCKLLGIIFLLEYLSKWLLLILVWIILSNQLLSILRVLLPFLLLTWCKWKRSTNHKAKHHLTLKSKKVTFRRTLTMSN